MKIESWVMDALVFYTGISSEVFIQRLLILIFALDYMFCNLYTYITIQNLSINDVKFTNTRN